MPLLPILAFPTTSSQTSNRPIGSFGCSLSQPTTPKNAQRMFASPFDNILQQQKHQQIATSFLHSPPNNRRNENKTILFGSQFPQRNGFVQSSDLTELCGGSGGTNGRTAASAR